LVQKYKKHLKTRNNAQISSLFLSFLVILPHQLYIML